MTQDELEAITTDNGETESSVDPVTGRTIIKPVLKKAVVASYERDDLMSFYDRAGISWMLRQRYDGGWYKIREPFC